MNNTPEIRSMLKISKNYVPLYYVRNWAPEIIGWDVILLSTGTWPPPSQKNTFGLVLDIDLDIRQGA